MIVEAPFEPSKDLGIDIEYITVYKSVRKSYSIKLRRMVHYRMCQTADTFAWQGKKVVNPKLLYPKILTHCIGKTREYS